MATFREQIRFNSVALISLCVALIALSYNTWRNETTESQRNIRQAAFRVLESLGELQEVADYRYYYFSFENGHGREGELKVPTDSPRHGYFPPETRCKAVRGALGRRRPVGSRSQGEGTRIPAWFG